MVKGDPSSSALGGRGGGGHRPVGDPPTAKLAWPPHILEAVVVNLAVNAVRTRGRLAAAPAIVKFISTSKAWVEAISCSEMLWEKLTTQVWCRSRRDPTIATWADEFIRLHRIALNFHFGHAISNRCIKDEGDHICTRLALTDDHLAAGFSDGSIIVFYLPDTTQQFGFGIPVERMGDYSLAISGILLLPETRDLLFGAEDGYIHLVHLVARDGLHETLRIGNPGMEGSLIDLAGNQRWCVGLYGSTSGQTWRVWRTAPFELVHVNECVADADFLSGLTIQSENLPLAGRVRFADGEVLVRSMGKRVQVSVVDDIAVADIGSIATGGTDLFDAVDACDGCLMLLDTSGMCRVHLARTQEELCAFRTAPWIDEDVQLMWRPRACMNFGYVIISSTDTGKIEVWDAMTGGRLYSLDEDTDVVSVVAASHRYLAIWETLIGMRIWDFGAHLV